MIVLKLIVYVNAVIPPSYGLKRTALIKDRDSADFGMTRLNYLASPKSSTLPFYSNNPNEAIVAQRFVEVDSTNAEALRQLRSPDNRPPQRSFFVTGHQTAGRGQAGNGWHDTPGSNLLATLVYYPQQLLAADLFVLNQISSLAVVETVEKLTGIEAMIKWPNDILVAVHELSAQQRDNDGYQKPAQPGDDVRGSEVGYQSSKVRNQPDSNQPAPTGKARKICGLLVQNSLAGKFVQWSVIGTGLNVNEVNFPAELSGSATSLRQLTGRELDLSKCEATYFATLLANIDRYLEPLDRISLQRNYLAKLYRLNEKAHYFNAASGTIFEGTIRDVDPSGQLVVEHRVGRLQRYGLKEIGFL